MIYLVGKRRGLQSLEFEKNDELRGGPRRSADTVFKMQGLSARERVIFSLPGSHQPLEMNAYSPVGIKYHLTSVHRGWGPHLICASPTPACKLLASFLQLWEIEAEEY